MSNTIEIKAMDFDIDKYDSIFYFCGIEQQYTHSLISGNILTNNGIISRLDIIEVTKRIVWERPNE